MIFYFGDTSFSTILTSCLSSHLSAALSAGVRLSLCQHLMFSSLQRCWQWKADVWRCRNTAEQDGASERGWKRAVHMCMCASARMCISTLMHIKHATTSCQNHKIYASGNVLWHFYSSHFNTINHSVHT